MKFGKALQETAERFSKMPFMKYKLIKQILKCMLLDDDNTVKKKADAKGTDDATSESENHFLRLLHQEVCNLNTYFIEEEENLVIRMEDLRTASQGIDPEENEELVPKLVKFHGDVILLLYWESINYTAFSKILKKHDKLKCVVPLRKRFLASLSQQPFYSKELLDRLSGQCEALINRFVPMDELTSEAQSRDFKSTETINDCEVKNLSKMQYAIKTWRNLADNAHTPSTVLPWSKPIPESMKSWIVSEEKKNKKSKSLSEEEDGEEDEELSGSATSSGICSLEDQEGKETISLKRLQKRNHQEISGSCIEDVKDKKAKKIARNL